MDEEVQAIIFFLIACSATVGSSWSLYFIWKYGSQSSISSQLLLALHLTLLIEEVVSYPYAYTGNANLCRTTGFFHFYSGLANIMVTGLLTLHFSNYLLFSNVTITHIIFTYKWWIIAGFPLITLLPFSTDAYGRTNDHWCTAKGDVKSAQIWAVAVFYGWAWIIILASFCLIVYVIYRARTLDNSSFKMIFSSIGIYDFVTIVCWIPRTVPRFLILFWHINANPSLQLWTAMPVYLSGLFYTVILYRDQLMLTVDEEGHVTGTAPVGSDIHFTWEDLEGAMIENYRRSVSTSALGGVFANEGKGRTASVSNPAARGPTKSPLLTSHQENFEKQMERDIF